ncbi:MAG: hypothetical protein Q8O64_01665 [Sideroxyarcus sp.]|nr:hypothetical protein [Sideroxyarcus sp.]
MSPDNSPSRHSRAGGNPVKKQIPRVAGQNQNVSRYAGYFYSWIPACAGMTGFSVSSGKQPSLNRGFE